VRAFSGGGDYSTLGFSLFDYTVVPAGLSFAFWLHHYRDYLHERGGEGH
jgi:hypothetical protein